MSISSIFSTNQQISGSYVSLTISNQFEELVHVALWLEQIAQHYKLPERTIFKLDVVLNEALPNIISYAYSDQLPHDILIKFEDNDDHVVLEIIDDGIAFNPFTTHALPEYVSLESASINGRGIHLIKSYSSAQEYQRVNNTNVMRVVIHKSPECNKKYPQIEEGVA